MAFWLPLGHRRRAPRNRFRLASTADAMAFFNTLERL
jgi:hypothetical protein